MENTSNNFSKDDLEYEYRKKKNLLRELLEDHHKQIRKFKKYMAVLRLQLSKESAERSYSDLEIEVESLKNEKRVICEGIGKIESQIQRLCLEFQNKGQKVVQMFDMQAVLLSEANYHSNKLKNLLKDFSFLSQEMQKNFEKGDMNMEEKRDKKNSRKNLLSNEKLRLHVTSVTKKRY